MQVKLKKTNQKQAGKQQSLWELEVQKLKAKHSRKNAQHLPLPDFADKKNAAGVLPKEKLKKDKRKVKDSNNKPPDLLDLAKWRAVT